MPATALLMIIDGAIAILTAAMPELFKLTKGGTVSPEDQQARLDKINQLRTDAAFEGPEWIKSGS